MRDLAARLLLLIGMSALALAAVTRPPLARGAAELSQLRGRLPDLCIEDDSRTFNTERVSALELGFMVDITGGHYRPLMLPVAAAMTVAFVFSLALPPYAAALEKRVPA